MQECLHPKAWSSSSPHFRLPLLQRCLGYPPRLVWPSLAPISLRINIASDASEVSVSGLLQQIYANGITGSVITGEPFTSDGLKLEYILIGFLQAGNSDPSTIHFPFPLSHERIIESPLLATAYGPILFQHPVARITVP